jgi:glycosyltransferase involved in cell wall biosynthesis
VDRNPRIWFAIAGEGPLRASLQNLIDELDLQKHFRLCGFRDDVGTFLSAVDLFVSSSHWEGLPLAIVEAIILEKPVVATAVGGVTELVLSGETGTLVPPGSPEELSTAILRAIDRLQGAGPDRAVLRKARESAARLSDPEVNARRFEELLA